MKKKSLAGFIFENTFNYLDHLAPFCSLLKIPLILTENLITDITKTFYPDLKIIKHDDYVSIFKFLCFNFKGIFSCHFLYSDEQSRIFKMYKDITRIWLSHGHSDKGWKTQMFQVLEKEKIALLYGKKMVDTFKQQNAFDGIRNTFLIGNFRYKYFLKNKTFYKNLIKKTFQNKIDFPKKTILYAPTWDDFENSSSFSFILTHLIKELPKKWNLIIKPHPNTFLQKPLEIEELQNQIENKKNIFILKNFPSIYPLLYFITDIYIGDKSSIGYDFLKIQKPMFFINKEKKDSKKDPGLYLFRCGTEIFPNQYKNIYKIIDKKIKTDKKDFFEIRKKTYDYTFAKDFNVQNLKKSILKIC